LNRIHQFAKINEFELFIVGEENHGQEFGLDPLPEFGEKFVLEKSVKTVED